MKSTLEAKRRTGRRRAAGSLWQSHLQLHALSVYQQYLREEECIRIARAVQHDLGQTLTGLKLELIWLANHIPSRLRQLHVQACSIGRHMDEAMVAIDHIVTQLRPDLLDTAGLPAALEWQAQEFQRRSGIRCRVRAAVAETLWDQDLSTAFFRIFQETLTNILRHARATEVRVRLLESNGNLVLEVKDNGCGISQKEIHNTRSIGLLSMRERAALLDGQVRWSSAPDKGTTVSISIPHPSGPADKYHHHENPHHRRPFNGSPGLEAHSR